MGRWRVDKKAEDADTIETVRGLLNGVNGEPRTVNGSPELRGDSD
jgi:hypothetical protein